MPKPDRLFEAHLTVADLDRSIAFYRDVVGLPLAFELRERAVAFFWIGERGGSMLGLWSLGSAPIGFSVHVAFRVSLAEVLAAGDALHASGVTQLSFFGTEASEPSVIGWMAAAAVYFRDPDGTSSGTSRCSTTRRIQSAALCPGRTGRARIRSPCGSSATPGHAPSCARSSRKPRIRRRSSTRTSTRGTSSSRATAITSPGTCSSWTHPTPT